MAHRTPPTKGPGPESGSGSGWAAGSDSGTRWSNGSEGSDHQDLSLTAGSSPVPAVVQISPTPFVWQQDRQLLLLDHEPGAWILAELRFDAAQCRYLEVRRARYRWPREAVGALLARGITAADGDPERLANDLLRWVTDSDSEAVSRPA